MVVIFIRVGIWGERGEQTYKTPRILPRLKSWILLFILVIPQTLKSQCFAGICGTTVQQAFREQAFLVQR